MKRAPTIAGRRASMGELREYVLELEGGCFAARVDSSHVCQGYLTLEHVTRVHYNSDSRRDDERHCVALCWGLNGISIASHTLREMMRESLRGRYPTCV